ncbi:SIS domain-containing protein [Clostridium sp. OS1-26]|uniref:D-sedoheptulose-7-phosphate isomerase n=1 Tax=Clostridium sp. OS1-26 TaxID=3070681 RepID=UPI0027E1AAAA|nr:SIS domain-containing protein [Clostridium sp. OS1-26]WML33170.1 SIS domain-containing protein [Clostridium sp. OS1-26]
MRSVKKVLDNLMKNYPLLEVCSEDIWKAYKEMYECYSKEGKILVCGNGGSAADSGHIVGELMKGFMLKRELPKDIKERLINTENEAGIILANRLQCALPAIDLTTQSALCTAFSNDVHPDLIYAQQVLAYGKGSDLAIGLSTSGNSKNVIYAICTAKALGIKTLGFTGKLGGKIAELCDVTIKAPKELTFEVQELHLPIYHALCQMVEISFF